MKQYKDGNVRNDMFTVCTTSLVFCVCANVQPVVQLCEIIRRQFDAFRGSNEQQGFHSLAVRYDVDME